MKVTGHLAPMTGASAGYRTPTAPRRAADKVRAHLASVDQALTRSAQERAELAGGMDKAADAVALSGKTDAYVSTHGRLAALEDLALRLQQRARELRLELDAAEAWEAAGPERAEQRRREARAAAVKGDALNAEARLQAYVRRPRPGDYTVRTFRQQYITDELLDHGLSKFVRKGSVQDGEPQYIVTDDAAFEAFLYRYADEMVGWDPVCVVARAFTSNVIRPQHPDSNPRRSLRY